LTRLFVNVDHVATIREARRTYEPDPLKAALLAEKVGVEGITVHLREDRRHIQDKDVHLIHKNIKTKLNLEIAAIKEMVELALELKPYQVSLVPEKRQEVTTEGGLNVCSQIPELLDIQKRINSQGILLSLFVDPDIRQIEASKEVEADSIEINTGLYSELTNQTKMEEELVRIRAAAKQAERLGLKVFAGHGLSFNNVKPIAAIPEIEELNIGHFLVAQSVYIGIEEAVKIMKQIIKTASS
jgi:pyridoxine 5-phosphate synthase